MGAPVAAGPGASQPTRGMPVVSCASAAKGRTKEASTIAAARRILLGHMFGVAEVMKLA